MRPFFDLLRITFRGCLDGLSNYLSSVCKDPIGTLIIGLNMDEEFIYSECSGEIRVSIMLWLITSKAVVREIYLEINFCRFLKIVSIS
jgi:hypothetical protein